MRALTLALMILGTVPVGAGELEDARVALAKCESALAQAQALLPRVEAAPDRYKSPGATISYLKKTIAEAPDCIEAQRRRIAELGKRPEPQASSDAQHAGGAVASAGEQREDVNFEAKEALSKHEGELAEPTVDSLPLALSAAVAAALGAVGGVLFLGLWPGGLEARFPALRDMRVRMGLGILLGGVIVGGCFISWSMLPSASRWGPSVLLRAYRVYRATKNCGKIFAEPQTLAGKSPAQVKILLDGARGWRPERLRRGAHQGQGWTFREYGANGKETGRLIRWHPGGGHHGSRPYWKVSSPKGGVSPEIR